MSIQKQDFLKAAGIPNAAINNELLLTVAHRAIASGIEPSEMNVKGNSFVQFPSDTPDNLKDGSFIASADARQVDWYDAKGVYTPLFFVDGQLEEEFDGAAAMSMASYAKEQPTEGSTLLVRTYRTKAGEVRASVN